MAIEASISQVSGGKWKKRKPHIGIQAMNWALLAASVGGALLAGIWTSGLLLGVFLPESMMVPMESQMEEVLTVFDYMASIVAGMWIGYVIFFVMWECILKRVGMFFNTEDPFKGFLAKWR